MKEKIIDALKNKYSNLGFGQKAFDGVASYLEKTVTDDSQLETVISGVEPLLKAFQSDIDRMRTEKSALQTQLEELQKAKPVDGGGQGKKNEPDKTVFDAEAVKADLLKTIREELAVQARQNQIIAQRTADIASKAKEYGIPEKFVSKLNISQDANLDEYFKGVKQDMMDAGFEFSEVPAQGGGMADNGNDIAKLIDKGTEQIVKSQNK